MAINLTINQQRVGSFKDYEDYTALQNRIGNYLKNKVFFFSGNVQKPAHGI